MSETALIVTAVLAGSAAGGGARLWLSRLLARACGERFPWGTLAVNLSGAALIGVAAGTLAAPDSPTGTLPWSATVIGFLGSYTTVSSFSLQTLTLLQDRRCGAAAANVVVSTAGCLGAAALALALTGAVSGA